MSQINRDHKDRLFCFIFGRKENKEWTLSLYNAVNGTSYKDVDVLELYTIESAVYMGMKNDVAFIMQDMMNLYEHQSSYNPNMPVRMLIYLSKLYEKFIEQKHLNRYGRKLIQLPVPKFVVFYNGIEEISDRVLQLSDSFPENVDVQSDISLSVKMYNINYGHNKKLMDACRPLSDYSLFIKAVRQVYNETRDMDTAFDHGINSLKNDSRIRQFLLGQKAEVTDMFLTEYNEEETMNMFKEEASEQKTLEFKHALSMLRDGASSVEEFTSQGITERVAKIVLGIDNE